MMKDGTWVLVVTYPITDKISRVGYPMKTEFYKVDITIIII